MLNLEIIRHETGGFQINNIPALHDTSFVYSGHYTDAGQLIDCVRVSLKTGLRSSVPMYAEELRRHLAAKGAEHRN